MGQIPKDKMEEGRQQAGLSRTKRVHTQVERPKGSDMIVQPPPGEFSTSSSSCSASLSDGQNSNVSTASSSGSGTPLQSGGRATLTVAKHPFLDVLRISGLKKTLAVSYDSTCGLSCFVQIGSINK